MFCADNPTVDLVREVQTVLNRLISRCEWVALLFNAQLEDVEKDDAMEVTAANIGL